MTKLSYKNEDVRIIVDDFIYIQLHINNQGVTKIAKGDVSDANDVEDFKLIREIERGASFSGGHSMVPASKAVQSQSNLLVIMVLVLSLQNIRIHHLVLSDTFARQIPKAGYIGFVCVGNGDFAAVAPTGLTEPKLGTTLLLRRFHTTGAK